MKRLIGFALGLLVGIGSLEAKLAPERWGRMTEEERHQLTRAERYVDQKQYKNALAEYELFLQLYGKSETASYAQLMYAECIRQQGQINTAMEEFRNVVDYFPGSPDADAAQYSIALCFKQSGDADKASEAMEKVIELSPKSELAGKSRFELLPIYWRSNLKDKWLTHLQYLATGEYADPDNLKAKAQRRLLMHQLANNQITEAYALVQSVQKKDSLLVFGDWSAEALRNNEMAQTYGEPFTKARPAVAAAAVALIDKEAVSDPSRKTEYDLRSARLLAAGGIPDKAIPRYEGLLNVSGENDSLRSEYAGYLRSIGKREEARVVYHAMKDSYSADRQIAETYGDENNWKRAIEEYQKMLEKYPDKTGDIQWRLGEIYQQSKKYPEAITAFQLAQRDPQGLFRVADCQNALKQYPAAIQTLTSVMNFFKPFAAEAQYKIAGNYADSGDKDAAVRTLKLVCKNYLKTPWAGRAHEDLSLKYGVDVTLGGASKKAE